MYSIGRVVMILVLILGCNPLPIVAQERVAKPTERQLEFLQERYEWAIDANLKRMHTMAHGYAVSELMLGFKYSAAELRDFGRWFLANAETPLELEKAVWFIDTARFRFAQRKWGLYATDGEVVPESLLDAIPELLYVGQAAMRVAEYYAENSDPYFGQERAVRLFYMAGMMGIQEGYLAAAYLNRSDGLTERDRKEKYDISRVHSTTRAWAKYAYTDCNEKTMSRELFPWTQELCDEAKELSEDADAKYQQTRVTYVNNGTGGAASLLEASIMIMAGIAAATGGSSSGGEDTLHYVDDKPSTTDIVDYGTAAFIFVE